MLLIFSKSFEKLFDEFFAGSRLRFYWLSMANNRPHNVAHYIF